MVVDQESLIETATIPDEELKRFVGEGEKALADRKPWEFKLRECYTSRYGIRAKKTFPWEGSSNLHIPFTEKVIRRIAPTFQSAIFRVSPIITIDPLGQMGINTARNLEQGYDWLVRYRMKNSRETMIFVEDATLTYGMAFTKTCWEYESETRTRTIKADFLGDVERTVVPLDALRTEVIRRLGLDPQEHEDQITDAMEQFYEGDEELSVSFTESIYDAPRWYFVSPEDLIVPWDASDNIDDLPWIIHRMRKTRREIEVAHKNGRYNSNARVVIESMGRAEHTGLTAEFEERKRFRERVIGSEHNKKSTAEIWEVYFHYDLDGDGVSEKYVGTYAFAAKKWLRIIPYEYEHNQWPFTRFAFESTEPRWYSPRGVPELLKDIQIEINANHNAWIDNMAIANSKSFVVRTGAIRKKNIRFHPGLFIEATRGAQDLAPITHQPMDFSHNNHEENLRAWGEELIGTPDFGISNINQRVERRTAREVDQIAQSTGAVADASLERFQESMRRQHRQTLFLWAQYGDDRVMVRVTGKDSEIPFVRFDIYNDYDLVPTGRIDNLSPQNRLQRALFMQSICNDPVLGPYTRPYEVTREIFENIDYRSADRFLQEPGVFDQEAVGKQANEIAAMAALGIVWPVDQREPHQIHAQTCIQSIQANQDNPQLVQLVSAHLAAHLFFLGQKQPLEQLQQQGAQVQQVGMQIQITLPQGQPEQEVGAA